jgi:Protein of unknown function (DUF1570)
MYDRMGSATRERVQVDNCDVSRRSCLIGCLSSATSLYALLSTGSRARADEDAADAPVIASIQAIARKAGLERFRTSHTPHFLGLGDAPDPFRQRALGICEELEKAFLAYFKVHGFKLALPAGRLTVITLKDDDSFRAFIGGNPGDEVGGQYDIEINQLVMFDFRDKKDNQPGNAERVNLFSLIHETAHLLSFNAGLLSRKADVPLCVSEGLATFVEMWRPKPKTRIGEINRPRIQVLFESDESEPWIPLTKLLADDDVFGEVKTRQLAYAECWLLMHYLIRTPTQLPKLQAYLGGLPPAGASQELRIQHAEKHLGSLQKLDRDVKGSARSVVRK